MINTNNMDKDLAKINVEPKVFKVTFNPDGGSVIPDSKDVQENFAVGELPIPTKSDYIFDGWYQNSGYTGTKITSTSQLTGNTLLYAKWLEMVENASYDSTTNTFTATNFTEPVSMESFSGNSDYDYTIVNATGSDIRRVEVVVSYTNNTGNTKTTMSCALYLT